MSTSSSQSPVMTLEFWIKAFIPQEVKFSDGQAYTLPVPGSSGSTMVPYPLNGTYVVPQNPNFDQPNETVKVDECYNTSNRGFSNDLRADAKMTSYLKMRIFDIGDRKRSSLRGVASTVGLRKWVLLEQRHECDPTTAYDCSTGRVKWSERAGNNRMRFTSGAFREERKFVLCTIPFKCAASLPRDLGARLFGDIDYSGYVTFDEELRRVAVDCYVDAFPAFEAYGSINGNPGVALFQLPPTKDATVKDLPGDANRRVKGETKIGDRVIWIGRRQVRANIRDSNGSGQFDLGATSARGDYRPTDGRRVTANYKLPTTKVHASSNHA